MNEFEGQVGQLRVEHSTLLNRLTEMNHKYDEAAVDNRIMKADIETLRAKVKMAEETVKRVTGINPGLLSRPNIPSVGMPFLSSPLEASTIAPLPMQSNANRFFHPVPSIVAPMHHNGVDNCFVGKTLVPPDMTSHTKVGLKNVTETSTSKRGPSLEGGHDQIGLGFHARGPMPGWEPGHAADRNHKQS
ncbi:Histone acetyltransferase [Hibiscus syriacus]|uniref:Histone acetyltransferase n=1 Tax=Hibiscus syriacus TaxID=106335 RepID=A0A6A2X2J6_HIBSY|nr:Histone acetyltransferase [Hibiscus syriacus]